MRCEIGQRGLGTKTVVWFIGSSGNNAVTAIGYLP